MGPIRRELVLVQLNGKIVGPYRLDQLRNLRDFSPQTLVSFPGSDKWAPAHRVLNYNPWEPLTIMVPRANDMEVSWKVPQYDAIRSNPPKPTMHFTGPVGRPTRGWTDRWFPRVALFNVLLALSGYFGWSYPPIRAAMKCEFFWAETESLKLLISLANRQIAPLKIANLQLTPNRNSLPFPQPKAAKPPSKKSLPKTV